MAAEHDASGNLLRRYIRLPGSVDETFLMIDTTLSGACTLTSYAACEVWAHQDRLGSVVATTDSTGAVIDKYRYSPYGKSGHEGLNGGGAPFNGGFPFRFTGQKLDAETGLYYYKARYYDPETGRFLQTDPIGYEDQMNLYAYVHNDPVNMWDPTGLCGTREESYQDCTINVDDRDSLTADQLKSVETLENKIRETGAAIADGGTDEEVAAWESIGAFNIKPNEKFNGSNTTGATAGDGGAVEDGDDITIWQPGVDAVTDYRNNSNTGLSAGHIVIHEVYHFTQTDRTRRAGLPDFNILSERQYLNAERANDQAAQSAGRRLGTVSSDYYRRIYGF